MDEKVLSGIQLQDAIDIAKRAVAGLDLVN